MNKAVDPSWRIAALMSDRARRAIRERRLTGESIADLAADYDVPVAFVTYLCSWQLFGDDPQPKLPKVKRGKHAHT